MHRAINVYDMVSYKFKLPTHAVSVYHSGSFIPRIFPLWSFSDLINSCDLVAKMLTSILEVPY